MNKRQPKHQNTVFAHCHASTCVVPHASEVVVVPTRGLPEIRNTGSSKSVSSALAAKKMTKNSLKDTVAAHIVYPRWVMQESSGFRLRVEDQLRHEFITACRKQDQAAAQVLRAFMRDYVAKHYNGQQENLFKEDLQSSSR
ncbi:hypothetical protein ALP09_200065 [Pseudomonas amygdali pv. lachrymans]|nr:hypothetical protein ALP09_200065 [Pseudomonas amygdali pv. lachrymans]